MTDVNCVFQFEMVGDGLQVVGIVIHIVAVAGLSRAAMSAPIRRDYPIAFGEKEQHLRVPIVRTERPAMAEHDGLSFAPVFVINSYSVFGFDVAHIFSFLLMLIHVCRPLILTKPSAALFYAKWILFLEAVIRDRSSPDVHRDGDQVITAEEQGRPISRLIALRGTR